jgi:hypothetical protein
MSFIYPLTDTRKSVYYVEFERGDTKGEFTLFRRQWMHSKEELDDMDKKSLNDSVWTRLQSIKK